tara:strand:+ start:110 stop:394 length:285 start_codon:yes stop_codon:yes gene_type:complete
MGFGGGPVRSEGAQTSTGVGRGSAHPPCPPHPLEQGETPIRFLFGAPANNQTRLKLSFFCLPPLMVLYLLNIHGPQNSPKVNPNPPVPHFEPVE